MIKFEHHLQDKVYISVVVLVIVINLPLFPLWDEFYGELCIGMVVRDDDNGNKTKY